MPTATHLWTNGRGRVCAHLRLLPIVLFCALLAAESRPNFAAEAQAGPAASPQVTVFLLRHAEKSAEPSDDPGLTDAGRARAEALARLLADADITHLFATQYLRTRQTLQPLADRRSLKTRALPARRTDLVVRTIRALPIGATAVLAGHSNTIPAILRELGVGSKAIGPLDERGFIPDDSYDRLYLLTWPRHAAGDPPLIVRIRIPQR